MHFFNQPIIQCLKLRKYILQNSKKKKGKTKFNETKNNGKIRTNKRKKLIIWYSDKCKKLHNK